MQMWHSVAFLCFRQSSCVIAKGLLFAISSRVFSSIFERPKSLSIAPHDQIRKSAWLMLLRFDCRALFFVWLASVFLSQNTFKFRVNNVWDFHLFVMVCGRHLVLTLFWHLSSGWAFQQPFAFLFMLFKQINSLIAMQAAFAKMFAFIVPFVIIKRAVSLFT